MKLTIISIVFFIFLLIPSFASQIGEFIPSNEIRIESQTFIDQFFNFEFNEINETDWIGSISINPGFLDDLRNVLSYACSNIRWTNLRNKYLHGYTITKTCNDLKNLTNYPFKPLTSGIQFSDFKINLTESRATFNIIFPEGFKINERAELGFGTTIINTATTIPFQANQQAICKDAFNITHVVWRANSSTIGYANNTAGVFSASYNSNSTGSKGTPHIDCFGNNITISYQNYTGSTYNASIYSSLNNGGSFNFLASGKNGVSNNIECFRRGARLYCIYENMDAFSDIIFFNTTNADGSPISWGDNKVLLDGETFDFGGFVKYSNPSVAVNGTGSANDELFIVFNEWVQDDVGTDVWQLSFISSLNSGVNFGSKTDVSSYLVYELWGIQSITFNSSNSSYQFVSYDKPSTKAIYFSSTSNKGSSWSESVLANSAIYSVNISILNESRNFVANNTFYSFANFPVNAFINMYANAANTQIYPSSRYARTSTQVKIYTNGTGGYPNMTTGTHYYSYLYNRSNNANPSITINNINAPIVFWQQNYTNFNIVYRNNTGSNFGVLMNATTDINATYVNTKRDYAGNCNEFLYMNGTSSPYSITYDNISVCAMYSAPAGDTTPPTFNNILSNVTNNTAVNTGIPISISARWSDNVGLSMYVNSSKVNASGSWANGTWQSFTSGNWSNFTIIFPSQQGSNITVKIYANDTSNNQNVTGTWYWYNVSVPPDSTPPTYSSNSTNSTLAGTPIEFRLKWTDETALSKAITSLWNGSSWVNASTWCSLSTNPAWCNQTLVVNSTAQTLWWKQYANDTSNNWNTSENFSLVTTSEEGLTKCGYFCYPFGDAKENPLMEFYVRNNDILLSESSKISLNNLDNENLTNLENNCLIYWYNKDYKDRNLCINLNSKKAIYLRDLNEDNSDFVDWLLSVFHSLFG